MDTTTLFVNGKTTCLVITPYIHSPVCHAPSNKSPSRSRQRNTKRHLPSFHTERTQRRKHSPRWFAWASQNFSLRNDHEPHLTGRRRNAEGLRPCGPSHSGGDCGEVH